MPTMPSRMRSSRPTPRSRAFGGAPFRPWLLRIVANEARNRRRSAGDGRAGAARRGARAARGEPHPEPDGAWPPRTGRELLAAIGALRDEDRENIGARFFLDLYEAETAETLGIPEARSSRGRRGRSAGCARSSRP